MSPELEIGLSILRYFLGFAGLCGVAYLTDKLWGRRLRRLLLGKER